MTRMTRDPLTVDHERYMEELAAAQKRLGPPQPNTPMFNESRRKCLARIEAVYRECISISALPGSRKLEYQLPHVFRNGVVMRLQHGHRRIVPRGRN